MKKPRKKNLDRKLVNQLTISDAQHLFHVSGGALRRSDIAFQLLSIAVVSGLMARAIHAGEVKIWHLFLPMLGEYMGYLFAVPIVQLFVRHPDLTVIARSCVRMLAIYATALVVAGLVWHWAIGNGILAEGLDGWAFVSKQIVDSQMYWPILLAAVTSAINAGRNVGKLIEFGPPFAGPGLGCAMRMLVFVVAAAVLPAVGILINSILRGFNIDPTLTAVSFSIVWLVWSLLLFSELFTLWFRWDIQRRLGRKKTA